MASFYFLLLSLFSKNFILFCKKVLNSAKDFLDKMMDKIKTANQHQVNLMVSQKKYSLLSGSLKDMSDFMFIILGIILIKTNHLRQ